MPTTIKTQNFNTLTAADPYIIGSAPDNLVGYALTTGSGAVKIFNTGTKELILAYGTRAIFYDTTNMTGVTIRSTIKMGNVNGNNRGGGVVDAAGNGYDDRNTYIGGSMIARQWGGGDHINFTSEVIQNAASGVVADSGAYTIVNGECVGSSGVVDANGRLTGSYNTNYRGKRGYQIFKP